MNQSPARRAVSPYDVAPQNRAQRRAQEQQRERAERAQRRSRARIVKALSNYSKEQGS